MKKEIILLFLNKQNSKAEHRRPLRPLRRLGEELDGRLIQSREILRTLSTEVTEGLINQTWNPTNLADPPSTI